MAVSSIACSSTSILLAIQVNARRLCEFRSLLPKKVMRCHLLASINLILPSEGHHYHPPHMQSFGCYSRPTCNRSAVTTARHAVVRLLQPPDMQSFGCYSRRSCSRSAVTAGTDLRLISTREDWFCPSVCRSVCLLLFIMHATIGDSQKPRSHTILIG